MKIIFMGTPDFALPVLQLLIDGPDEITAVFTQPDKPKGRKAVLSPPPVKELAQRYNIPVFQPSTLKSDEAASLVSSLNPDLIIVVAYGKILPQAILSIPKYGAVNVHASLLPKLRGAAPIQWSIITGETVTGVTTMQMDAGLDTGDMLVHSEICIGENETYGELHDRLAVLGAQTLAETLRQLREGKLSPVKQDDSLHTYAPMLSKQDSPIDWNDTAHNIHNKVRGLNPWPSAATELGNKKIKVHKTAVFGPVPGEAGTFSVIDGALIAVCGDGMGIELLEIQPEGSKTMTAAEYLRGHSIA